MPLSFDRPVGATADVAELEYISALMQTEKLYLRQDGSLTANDIHFFLKSRYGIKIDVNQIEREIIGELGASSLDGVGGDERPVNDEKDVAKKSLQDGNANTQDTEAEDVELAVQEEETVSQEQPQRERPQLVRQNPIPLKLRTLRLSQQVTHSDYQKYLQYECLQQSTLESSTDAVTTTVATNTDDGMKIDLAQITSLLLIPKLRKLREDCKDEGNQNSSDDEDIINLFLAIVIQENHLSYGQEITPEILSLLVVAPSVTPRRFDKALAEMMEYLKKTCPDGIPCLDRETILRVLTEDIMSYNVDIINCTQETAIAEINSMKKQDERTLKRIYMASNIDTNADTYRSSTWTILTWYVVVTTLLAYLFNGISPIYKWKEPSCANTDYEGTFLCAIAQATYHWIQLLIMLSVVGFPFYFFATQGNSIYHTERPHLERARIGFSMMVVLICVLVPYAYRANYGLFHSGPSADTVEAGKEVANNRVFLGPVSLGLGALLFLVQGVELLPDCLRNCTCFGKREISRNLRSALETKYAAIQKVDRLLRNTAKCHLKTTVNVQFTSDNVTTKPDLTLARLQKNLRPLASTMVKYQQSVMEVEKAGGIIWSWRKIRDRTLFYDEGIWLWQRLVATNISQWLTILAWIGVVVSAQVSFGKGEDFFEGFTNDQLLLVVTAGFPLALFTSFYISVTYVPSAISSLIKYRSGVRGSLGDKRFLQNRFAMDSANLLFGAAFWTCLTASALIYGIVSLFTFLCMFSGTQPIMIGLVSNLIGMLITVTIKQVIMLIIRSRWSRGYYRSEPAIVNVSNAIQEVWNLGITTFTAITRAFNFLAIFLFYLGRVDTVVFSPGIGWFLDAIPLDGLPYCFLRDLLIHDAHRHPWIERLGYLYMTKLRLGPEFGQPGGSAWRLCFTITLMPWLRKYRQTLGVCGEKKKVEEVQRSALKSLSKDALVDNLVVLEQRYAALAEKMKKMGEHIHFDELEKRFSFEKA